MEIYAILAYNAAIVTAVCVFAYKMSKLAKAESVLEIDAVPDKEEPKKYVDPLSVSAEDMAKFDVHNMN